MSIGGIGDGHGNEEDPGCPKRDDEEEVDTGEYESDSWDPDVDDEGPADADVDSHEAAAADEDDFNAELDGND